MPIDQFLASLERRLRGPRRARAELIREARGGLEDAAEAHRAAGADPVEAQRRAVAEFAGDALDELAGAYQLELSAGQGRRLALLLLLLPAGMILNSLLWWRPPGDAAGASDGFRWLVGAVSLLCYLGGALALAALVRLRRVGDPRPLVRGVGLLALAMASSIWLLGTVASLGTLAETPGALRWPPMVFALLLLHGAQGAIVVLSVRTIRLAR